MSSYCLRGVIQVCGKHGSSFYMATTSMNFQTWLLFKIGKEASWIERLTWNNTMCLWRWKIVPLYRLHPVTHPLTQMSCKWIVNADLNPFYSVFSTKQSSHKAFSTFFFAPPHVIAGVQKLQRKKRGMSNTSESETWQLTFTHCQTGSGSLLIV